MKNVNSLINVTESGNPPAKQEVLFDQTAPVSWALSLVFNSLGIINKKKRCEPASRPSANHFL